MPELNSERLEGYLSSIYKTQVRIGSISEIGKEGAGGLKGFGYGIPYVISFFTDSEVKRFENNIK